VPTYYFNLHTPGGMFLDADGTELANDVQAEQHAKAVALELMCGRNAKTRSWRLETSDSGHRPLFRLLFAMIDPSLDQMSPPWRHNIKRISGQTADFSEAIARVRISLHQIRATLAKSNRVPFLATLDGVYLG